MSSVFLINVGSNTEHRWRARSPIFEDGSFVYVPFPTSEPMPGSGYPAETLPFVRRTAPQCTHADPDWPGLTYGDDCSNGRAAALKNVKEGDILLFWGLLWRNTGSDWQGFTEEKGWHLFGSLHVEEIAVAGQALSRVSDGNRDRARRNAQGRISALENGKSEPAGEEIQGTVRVGSGSAARAAGRAFER